MSTDHLISLQPGTVIAGRYEVIKCLGAGSMGMVYSCRHREVEGHSVAVKVLFPEVAKDPVAAARFKNEVFASYGVTHPNVVRAYEFIRDGDMIAYTMEFVPGGDLADRLGKPDQKMPIPEVVRIWSQMCLGVQAIHDAGIVHRDLKPENILIGADGTVKIADFGIARVGHGQRLTEHGGVVGTIEYVSPEYMMNSQVDWRSDIYAMGILAYEMIAGGSPFPGDSFYVTMNKRLKSDPPPPSSIRAECPLGLDKIVLKAMHRDPEQRYQSAAEIYRELSAMMPASVGAPFGSVAGAKKAGVPLEPVSRKVTETLVGSDTLEEERKSLVQAYEMSQMETQETHYHAQSRGTGGFGNRGSVASTFVDPFDVKPAGMEGKRSQGTGSMVIDGSSSDRMDPLLSSEMKRRDTGSRDRKDGVLIVNRPGEGHQSGTRRSGSSGSIAAARIIELAGARSGTSSSARKIKSRSILADIAAGLASLCVGIVFGFVILQYAFPDLAEGVALRGVFPARHLEWFDRVLDRSKRER